MRCELTEMDVEACAHCRTIRGPAWEAKYNGTCGACKQPIDIGERVRWSDAGDTVQHDRHR